MVDQSQIHNSVRRIVTMLAEADYSGLERVTNGHCLTANEIAGAALEYGRTICALPTTALQQIDIIWVTYSQPIAWIINVRLWTVEEGASDLTLELTIKETGTDTLDVEIDGLRVL